MLKKGKLRVDGEDLNRKAAVCHPGIWRGERRNGEGKTEGELGGWGREDVFISQSLSCSSTLCSSQPEPGPERVQ